MPALTTWTVRWIREGRYDVTGFTASTDVILSNSVVGVALIQVKQYGLTVMKRSEKLNSLADLLSRNFRGITGSKYSVWKKCREGGLRPVWVYVRFSSSCSSTAFDGEGVTLRSDLYAKMIVRSGLIGSSTRGTWSEPSQTILQISGKCSLL